MTPSARAARRRHVLTLIRPTGQAPGRLPCMPTPFYVFVKPATDSGTHFFIQAQGFRAAVAVSKSHTAAFTSRQRDGGGVMLRPFVIRSQIGRKESARASLALSSARAQSCLQASLLLSDALWYRISCRTAPAAESATRMPPRLRHRRRSRRPRLRTRSRLSGRRCWRG